MTHRGGHGQVTLPAEYVHEHVRLGYAATEHGWQSDTVTTALALASPATTRRGLYVAATRGTDINQICVITDSDDVAEARDVLESILAVDRADVPAVAQRRSLAQPQRGRIEPAAAAPTSRCAIPEWFPPLLDEARRSLAEAAAHDAEWAARRQQLTEAAATADHTLSNVATATAPARDAFAQAEARAKEARWRHAAAERRLDAAPRGHRRTLRTEVEVTQRQLERAEDYLERTRQRTAPSTEQHRQALANRWTALNNLRSCDAADLLAAMGPSADDHRRHEVALATWQQWAEGHSVRGDELSDAVELLNTTCLSGQGVTTTLVTLVRGWAAGHGVAVVELDALRTVGPPGAPELELEF